ncbi:50S ribosomal protein L16 [Candidatus Pacearchaeota archaeon]|nr:50S ribosomal protein L16 [Candidatus Pacearchaeota archaeon]
MPVRKASAYSKRKPVVYTRKSKITQKSYIKMIPPQKVVKFNMGDYKGYEQGKYKYILSLVVMENVQVRDLALEAMRQSLLKDLADGLATNFFMRCNVYPHNILRNNRIFSGGSKGERVQTGMQKSFGSPEGRAATVKKGKSIFSIYFNGDENIPKVREFFRKVKPKMPGHTVVNLEVLKK